MKRMTLASLVFIMIWGLVGCGSPSGKGLLQTHHIESAKAVQKVKIEYIKTQLDGQFLTTTLDQHEKEIETLLLAIESAKAFKPTASFHYGVPSEATHTLSFISSSDESFNFYYDATQNIISVPQEEKSQEKTRLYYLYFKPEPSFKDTVTALQAQAEIPLTDPISADVENLLLRASVSQKELSATGKEISFNFTQTPQLYISEEPLYHVYRNQDLPDVVPKDQFLVVTSLGKKDKADWIVDIDSIEVTKNYVKIRLFIEAASENADVVAPYYPGMSAQCTANDFPIDKMIVFVNEENEVLDVQKFK